MILLCFGVKKLIRSCLINLRVILMYQFMFRGFIISKIVDPRDNLFYKNHYE